MFRFQALRNPTLRFAAVSAAGVVLAAALSFQASVAQAAEIPKRKPGHWQLTTVTPGVGKRVFDVCVAEDDNIAVPKNAGKCGEPEVLEAGSETIVNVTCTVKDAKQTISTALNGNFDERYHAVVKMSFDPPMGGQDRFGVTIDGKYIGPDCTEGDAAKEQSKQ
ncbi:hypothetical protein A7A08_01033 [Methyloligella halotolerans]|uniref:DUF3617 family protein n=1 Tax=Methyloligella halotolerans TaxID=1177755 RepID=A0A1E2S047_9HYPH|nr:DUF3617 family protein [Methyloligella halotolerans]ODA67866.1 hypothetical protein A7A08_01033 [Methyloligella halotolerans]